MFHWQRRAAFSGWVPRDPWSRLLPGLPGAWSPPWGDALPRGNWRRESSGAQQQPNGSARPCPAALAGPKASAQAGSSWWLWGTILGEPSRKPLLLKEIGGEGDGGLSIVLCSMLFLNRDLLFLPHNICFCHRGSRWSRGGPAGPEGAWTNPHRAAGRHALPALCVSATERILYINDLLRVTFPSSFLHKLPLTPTCYFFSQP